MDAAASTGSQANRLSSAGGYQFLIATTILLGIVIRLAHLAFLDLRLPFRYGGLFAEFARQIAANGYVLPQRILFYTDGGIPFAYPPLPFYIEAILASRLDYPAVVVATALPAVLAALAVPSFYVLALNLELTAWTRWVALVAFATMPCAFWEQLEGGGLAEAAGGLALIWLAICLVRAHRRNSPGRYALAGLAWAVCIVAAPGSAYASVLTVAIFAVVQLTRPAGRSWPRELLLLATTGIIAVVISSPYWLTVVANHGSGIFTNSFGSQQEGGSALGTLTYAVEHLVAFRGASGVYGDWSPFLWDVAILAGLVGTLMSRRWALAAWFVAMYAIPREGTWLVAAPGALLAGIGVVEVLAPLVVGLASGRVGGTPGRAVAAAAVVLLAAYALSYPFLIIRDMVSGEEKRFTHPTLAAMEWVRDNTPPDGYFVVLPDGGHVTEWAPHLMRRTVLNVGLGLEWEPEKRTKIQGMNKQLESCRDFDCIQARVAQTTGHQEVYLVIDTSRLSRLVVESAKRLEQTSAFDMIWQNDELTVGRLAHAP